MDKEKASFKRVEIPQVKDEDSIFTAPTKNNTTLTSNKRPVWLVVLQSENKKDSTNELWLTNQVDWHASHIVFSGAKVESISENTQDDFDKIKSSSENLHIPIHRVIKVKNTSFAMKK